MKNEIKELLNDIRSNIEDPDKVMYLCDKIEETLQGKPTPTSEQMQLDLGV